MRPRDNTKTAFISYEYTVAGESYTGTRAYFFQGMTVSRDSEELKEHYPVDSYFTIYYDPAHPDRAVINKELRWNRLIFWLGGISCLLTLFVGFSAFRWRDQFLHRLV